MTTIPDLDTVLDELSGPTALSVLTELEKAAVLDELMSRDIELEQRAEHAGRQLLATVTRDDVASSVAAGAHRG